MTGDTDHGEINKLLSRILRGSERADHTSNDWMVPIGMPYLAASGEHAEAIFYGLDGNSVLKINRSAQENLSVLARLLQNRLASPEEADAHFVEREIMAAIGDVKLGVTKYKGLGQRLIDSVVERFARSVTVAAVGGLEFADLQGVARLGDRVLLGPLNGATESEIAMLSKDLVGHTFELTGDVWWTEDLLAYRSDASLFEHGSPNAGLGLIAVCIDSVDVGASIRAMELIEAILGALWILDQRAEVHASSPPWILGTPTTAEEPRDPDSGPESALRLDLLQVSTRDLRTAAITFDAPHPHVEVAEIIALPWNLLELVAQAETPGPQQGLARRLAAACRLARLAGQDTSHDLEILHLVVALEALVSDHAPGAGVTTRFVQRLLALHPPERRDAAALEALYKMRSEVGHQGFSADSRTRLAKAASFGQNTVYICVLAFAALVSRHGFGSEVDLMVWLDRTAPDTTDPFA